MKIVRLLSAFLLAAAPAVAQGAFLGVQVGPVEGGGVQLVTVQPDTAAEIMGLRAGDRVMSVDGRAVNGPDAFVAAIGGRLPGEIVRFVVLRGDESTVVRGVLGRRPGLTGLQVPAVPGQGGQPWVLEMPDLPEGWSTELEGLHEQLQQLHEGGIPQLREQLRGLPFTMELESVPGWGGSFDLHIPEGLQKEVKVRYPGSTPEEEREAMIEDARRKYGPDVEVSFEGEGTSVTSMIRGGFGGDAPESLHELLEGGHEIHVQPAPGAPGEHAPHGDHGDHADHADHGGWHASLDEALAAARESGKPVLVDFTAEWCGPCKMLGAEVLHHADHAALIGRFEAVQVDVDQHRELAEEYGVGGIPDLRVLNPDGSLVQKTVGYGGAAGAVAWLEKGLAAAVGKAEAPADPRKAELMRLREELQRELETARKQLEELRRELGEGDGESDS